MSDEQYCPPRETWKRRLAGGGVVLAGIVLGQVLLYGPSLAGWKVLLPVDILAGPRVYLPRTPEFEKVEPKDMMRMDLVCYAEPARRFATAEWQAGRMPLWAPYHFSGAPFIWPKFSPFLLLECCTASPVGVAWGQLLAAMVGGLGAYLFFRRVLGVGFWPAAVAAWCYPLTGFFVFWQGFPTALPVCWLPWLLLAVDRTARGAGAAAPVGLSVMTCLVLVSGQLDVAAQVLLVSGVFGLWRVVQQARDSRPSAGHDSRGQTGLCSSSSSPSPSPSSLLSRRLSRGKTSTRTFTGAVLRLAAGWVLGLMLAACYILPVLEYTQTGSRMAGRAGGKEERAPVGLAALPQVVLPLFYGSTENGSFPALPAGETNLQESAATAYAGLLATLLVAPLAFCNRRHLATNGFWTLLALFGLSWSLNVPGLVQLLRLPGLKLMSHDRLAFAAGFSCLALTALGLEALAQGGVRRCKWLWLPPGLLLGLGAWCLYRSLKLPEPLATQVTQWLQLGHPHPWVKSAEAIERAQGWFIRYHLMAAAWCGVGLVAWWLLWWRRPWQSRLLPALGALLVGELLWFAHGRSMQCERALYYPPIPALEQVAKAAPGRVIGYRCLPATLAGLCGLRDVRGYDAVDPARMVELLATARDSRSTIPPYAATQWLIPKLIPTPEGNVRLPPVLDLLGVRYVIFRGEPPPETRPVFQSPDYWVLENQRRPAASLCPPARGSCHRQ